MELFMDEELNDDNNFGFVNDDTIRINLLDEKEKTGVQYGLNWGYDPKTNELRIEKGKTETNRSGNEAYFQLLSEVFNTDFFPAKEKFHVIDDQNHDFIFSRTQPKVSNGNPQALSTSESNRILGLYLRHRLGLKSGQLITKQDLLNYGRTDIVIKKINSEYLMDFSSKKGSSLKTNNYVMIPLNLDSSNDREQIKRNLISELNTIKAMEKDDGFNLISQLVLFGIQNGKAIMENDISANELANDSDITDNYHQHLRSGIQIYNHFKNNPISENVKIHKPYIPLNYTPCNDKIKAYNHIVFGAPGTGKSFQLKQESTAGSPFANIERVTFHPEYSYGQFVGSYKPVSDEDGKIRYEYVPGPFMRTLVAALESGKKGDSAEKYLLIVEEINRAKVAAVFGDMFQLLDRTDKGESMYEIQASEDVRRYLAKELGGTKDNYTTIKIPNNMYIWATMNSADQGVFPMDTAFKRRWEFTYLGINANDKKIEIKNLPIKNPEGAVLEWNTLRKSINSLLLRECKVNEDKLLGPFFISGDVFKNAEQDVDAFYEAFNSKVLMYLFEDAGKMHQKKLFAKVSDTTELTFSKVCEEFRANGTAIFGSAFQLVK